MKWFGPKWNAPITELAEQDDVPVGEPCAYCTVPIKEGDRGLLIPHVAHCWPEKQELPWHLGCLIANVCGRATAAEITNIGG